MDTERFRQADECQRVAGRRVAGAAAAPQTLTAHGGNPEHSRVPDRSTSTFTGMIWRRRNNGAPVRRIADMDLHPPNDVATIRLPDKAAGAVHQRRVQQRDQRREMRIVAVMRSRRQQQQSVRAAGQDLGQPAALGVVAETPRRRSRRNDAPHR